MPEGHPAPRDGGASLQVKICGLTRPEDAALAGRLGADRIGVILVPDTPRFRTAVEARELGEAAGVPLVVVVGDAPAEEVAEWAQRAGAAAIQLHGGLRPPGDARPRGGARAPDASPGVEEGHDLDTMAWLRAQGPWELWKVLRVRSGVEILPAARRWEAAADLLLLDAWHPTQLGGSGTTFSWAALESVRTAWPPSLGLGVAGGLRPESVAEAVHRLRPRLVDVSSGVEASPGVKDPAKLRAFLDAARQAMARLDDDGVPAARRRPSHPSSPLPS